MTDRAQSPTPATGVERIHIGAVDRGPRMRAWAPHDVVRRIDDFKPGAGAKLRAEIPPVALESLMRTGRLEWISIRHGREFSAAAYEVLGDAEGDAFFRWMLPAQLDRPVLRGIVRASRAVFGLSPMMLLRATASGWGLAFLEVAQPRIEIVAPQHAILVLDDVCDDALIERAFLRSFGAAFEGFFDVSRVPGRVATTVDNAAKIARYEFVW